MPEIRKLSYYKNHSHVAYLRDDRTGVTSTDANHSHELMAESVPGQPEPVWSVLPGGGSGHSHEFTEFKGPKPDKPSDDELAQEVVELYKQLKKNEQEDRERAEEAEKFYEGDQWDKSDKAELESKGRAALVLNHVQPSIDLLSGYQRQNRTDVRFAPVEDSDARSADVLNMIVKQIMEQNGFYVEQSKQFEDEAIVGRGFVEVSEEPNEFGDIEPRIGHVEWDAVYLGPHNNQDMSDLLVMCKSKWFSRPEIKRLFPEITDKLPAPMDPDEDRSELSPHVDNGRPYTPEQSKTVRFDASNLDTDLVNLAKNEYRVIECVRKEYETVPIAVEPRVGFVRNLQDLSKSEIGQVRTIPNLRLIERQISRMRLTRTLANILIDDDYPDWSYNDFGLCPAYAYFRKGRFWGKVRAMIDPQREINKRHSQAVDILNRAAGYGWFFDQDTFPNMAARTHFEENSSIPGFVQEIKDINKPPKQQEGTKTPVEVLQMEQNALEQFRAISNINEEMLGVQSNATSGVAILERKRQGLVGQERLFDSLSMSQKRVAKLLVKIIQARYSVERIMRIIQSAVQRNPDQMIGQQPASGYDPAELAAMIKNADLTKYDVFVTESPASPTVAQANFMILSDLAKQGVPIPPQLLLKYAPIPEKREAMAMVTGEMQRQQQIEQGKQDTEIQKTMISARAKQGGAQGGAA